MFFVKHGHITLQQGVLVPSLYMYIHNTYNLQTITSPHTIIYRYSQKLYFFEVKINSAIKPMPKYLHTHLTQLLIISLLLYESVNMLVFYMTHVAKILQNSLSGGGVHTRSDRQDHNKSPREPEEVVWVVRDFAR